MVVPQRPLQVPDGDGLGLTQPPGVGVELRHGRDAGPKAAAAAAVVDVILDLPLDGLGLVEPEHTAGPRLGVHPAGEVRLGPRRLVAEWQQPVDHEGGQRIGDVALVLECLRLDARQGRALFLRLDDADRLPVDEQHVVGRASRGHQLPHGHTKAGIQVDSFVVLHHPAGRGEHRIDALPGLLFGVHVRSIRRGHVTPEATQQV